MRTPTRARLAAALVLVLPAYAFVSADAAAVDEFDAASDNIEHLGNLPYTPDGASQGSDLEFATLTLGQDVVDREGLTEADDVDPDTPGIQRRYAAAGAYNHGMQLIDVSDPEAAEIVGVYDCGIAQGDVQVFTRDDLPGRTFATFTWDTGYSAITTSACFTEAAALGFRRPGNGTFIAEITDPYRPVTVSYVQAEKGSHNQTVHPSGRYLYNSNSELITNATAAGIEYYSIEDFANPVQLGVLPLPPRPGLGTDSHDITFNADGTRAYSAALSQTVIIDTTDPAAPSIITSFVDPAINVEHQSDPVTLTDATTGLTRDFLIIEDEFAGAAGAEQTCPSGGVHVYDVTGDLELTPVKVGYWNIDDLTTTKATAFGRCTAHVFQLHPDEALMTIAFYNLGVSVVDLSGLVGVALGANGVGMQEVAYASFADSDTWAVKAPFVTRSGSFEIYGNDQNRGMDVYRVTLDLPPVGEAEPDGVGRGTAIGTVNGARQGTGRDLWLSPAAALQRARLNPADLSDYRPYCLLGDDTPLGG